MELNPIFRSHMVFAAGLPIRIYGEGKGKATITFGGVSKIIVSEKDKWETEFPPMEYGGPYELIFESGEIKTVYTDIFVGEVYLFAGQSNMQFKLKESSFPKELYESDGRLRLFAAEKIEKGEFFTPKDGWVISRKDEIGNWSAVAYLTAREIATVKNIAVGVIACFQGASVIESWIPKGSLENAGILIAPKDKHDDHFIADFAQWNSDGIIYSRCVSRVIPFSVSAVIWYQGESDTSLPEARVYGAELAVMINTWRRHFKNCNLPFIVVQIADFIPRDDEAWHTLQAQQLEIQDKIANVKTVISADVCEKDDIHPPTKDILAKRIAKELI